MCVIPTMAAIFLLICEKNIKVYFTQMFSGKITIKYIFIGVILLFAGIFDSYCYSFIVKTDVFKNTYSTVISLLTSCIYLLITAFVEEIAWRGFLLERLPFKKIKSVLFVGAVWAVWPYANVDHQKFIGHGTNCLFLHMDITCFRCFGNNLLSMQKYIADCHYARSF